MSKAKAAFLTSAHDQADALMVERIPQSKSTSDLLGGESLSLWEGGSNRSRGWGYAALILAVAAVWLVAAPSAARAAKVLVRLEGGGIYYKDVDSYRDRRMTKVVAQTEDFSCGAAALATLLRYHYGRTVNEREAILGMFKSGEREEIRKRGFSLLDMKKFCQDLQFRAEGFQVKEVLKLRDIKIPVIALLDTRQYKHFVVIRGADDRFVYLSDPSFGNRKMSLEDFNEAWNHVVFVVTGTVNGTPEGLYVERNESGLPKDQVAEIAYGNYWNRLALDPTFSLVQRTVVNKFSLSGLITGSVR